ncbi:GNAT family N-acetyltransferase [Comamonas sp. CMM02]|uniref:GNAT family N-acetyltransferase n=1 Tax=Comamonas sp. CMM02 TaxID=2769307 RepID=UPI001CE17762|nr:GNAT family N-acetyltransferase [Comamonas sp. CMM02]
MQQARLPFGVVQKEAGMEIRKFKMGDEAALFHVYFTAIHEVAIRNYTQEQVNAWAPPEVDQKMWAQLVQKIQPFVAVLNGVIVGYADVQASGYIDHFFVSGHYPRQGIGTQLMARIHEEAEFLKLTELTSNVSKTAEPFFALHGFSVLERRSEVLHGVTLQNARMRKALA